MTLTEQNKLAPPQRLEAGSIVTVRMQGHTHSPGQAEYFAPAVVLAQYPDDYGSIDLLVWDSSAGNHFAHGYHARELASRGEGGEREMYELKSNIGQVLFSPEKFSEALNWVDMLRVELDMISKRLAKLEGAGKSGNATTTQATPPKAEERK